MVATTAKTHDRQSRIGVPSQGRIPGQITNGGMTTMLDIRKTVLIGLAIVASGAVWHAKTIANIVPPDARFRKTQNCSEWF